MRNGPSKAIIIMGSFIFISNLFFLWGSFNEMPYLSSSLRPFGAFFYFIDVIFFLSQLIASIGLFRLRKWAWQAIIVLGVLNIIFLFLPLLVQGKSCFLSTNEWVEQNQSHLTLEQQNNYKKLKIILAEKTSKHPLSKEQLTEIDENAPKMAVASDILSLLWYLFMIFFFTRSKIKEQFKVGDDV